MNSVLQNRREFIEETFLLHCRAHFNFKFQSFLQPFSIFPQIFHINAQKAHLK